MGPGDAEVDRETILFVCRHGAAKSVLAAADFRTLAAERGLDLAAMAVGIDPDPEVATVLVEALPADHLGEQRPRAVTAADIASASRVITFNLAPSELPMTSSSIERWDDVPSVSENLTAARDVINRHLVGLIASVSNPDAD